MKPCADLGDGLWTTTTHDFIHTQFLNLLYPIRPDMTTGLSVVASHARCSMALYALLSSGCHSRTADKTVWSECVACSWWSPYMGVHTWKNDALRSIHEADYSSPQFLSELPCTSETQVVVLNWVPRHTSVLIPFLGPRPGWTGSAMTAWLTHRSTRTGSERTRSMDWACGPSSSRRRNNSLFRLGRDFRRTIYKKVPPNILSVIHANVCNFCRRFVHVYSM